MNRMFGAGCIGAVVISVAACAARAELPASAPALPSPTRVTLHLVNEEPYQAFQKLFAAVKLSTEGMEPKWFAASKNHKITIDLVNQPFLAAFVELCRQGAMEPNINNRVAMGIGFQSRMLQAYVPPTTRPDGAVRRMRTRIPPTTRRSTPAPSWVELPFVTSGPFLIAPREALARSLVSFDHPSKKTMSLSLETAVEPGIRVHRICGDLIVDYAEDDRGRSLMLDDAAPRTSLEPHPTTQWHWITKVNLKYPSPDAKRIARLAGYLRAEIVADTGVVELSNLNQKADRTINSIRMKFGPLEGGTGGRGYAFPVVVFRDNRPVDEWREIYQMMQMDRTVQWTDAQGQRISVETFSNDMPNEQDVQIWFTSRIIRQPNGHRVAPKPVHFIWNVPIDVEEVRVPVLLKDLPLP